MLELFPDTARVEAGALSIGGIAAAELARQFGTPLVVYDEATIRTAARAYREAAPDALIAYFKAHSPVAPGPQNRIVRTD